MRDLSHPFGSLFQFVIHLGLSKLLILLELQLQLSDL